MPGLGQIKLIYLPNTWYIREENLKGTGGIQEDNQNNNVEYRDIYLDLD